MTDPRVGTVLAGHRLLSVIGRGGMSVVYLAEHIGLHRTVALKVLSADLAEDETFRERFIRESRMAAALDHPNIVTVYDAGEANGLLYISMRNVEGTDLEHLLKEETRLDPGRATAIVAQVAAALDSAHEAGLVHRDVKPGNILLAAEPGASADHAFLSDFGVTKRVETRAGLTRTGQFVGTVDYVAPEQIHDDDVDGRADVYSLACVLYRCLVGEVPFPRETEVATIYAQLQDPPPVPSERRRDLPGGFDAPIARALAKSPDDRFDTCRGFAEAARAVVRPSRDVEVAHTTALRPATTRRRIGLAAIGLAFLAVLVIAAIAFDPSDDVGAPDGTGSPPPSSPVPQLTWKPVADQHAFIGPGDQLMTDATQFDGTIVGVGEDETNGETDAAVWTSTDGLAWARAGSLGRIGDQRMTAVTSVGRDLVAVGSERSGGDTDAAVWRSNDGSTWGRVEGAASGLHGAGDQTMEVVVVAAPGLVAAGSDAAGADLDVAVWASKDGSGWRRRTLPLPGMQQVRDATTLEEDLFLVGSSTAAGGDLDAAVWVRTGGAWRTIGSEALGGPGDQQIEAIVSGGVGLVAVGWSDADGDVDAAVWASDDGGRWDRVADTALADGGDQMMSSVTSAGATLVAGGSSSVAGESSDVAIWLSSDGALWERTPAPPLVDPGNERIVALMALASDRVLAAGSQEQAGNEQAAAWIARLVSSDLPA
jgi:serine/threonine-protein kinase